MHVPRTIVVAALTAIFAATIQAAQGPSRDELLQEFQALLPPDASTRVQNFNANGFRIESSHNKEVGGDFKPNGKEFQTVVVNADGVFQTIIEKGRPSSTGGGLAIFHRHSGEPILSVSDTNGDGQLDGLSYTTVDATGKAKLTVIDYEADGQLDLKVNFVDHYTELWHNDRWYRLEVKEGRRGIVKDGVFVELQRENNRYYVP